MRKIYGHELPSEPVQLEIQAIGPLSAGGANNIYQFFKQGGDVQVGEIHFQNGSPLDGGVNGVTLEALMTVCIDRLGKFQEGPFASTYNAEALVHLTAARSALHKRTTDRIARDVEGKTVP
jgi:hypothetical protein